MEQYQFTKEQFINFLNKIGEEMDADMAELMVSEEYLKDIFKHRNGYASGSFYIIWSKKEKRFLYKRRLYGQNFYTLEFLKIDEIEKLEENYNYFIEEEDGTDENKDHYWIGRMLYEVKLSDWPYRIEENKMHYEADFVKFYFEWDENYKITKMHLRNKLTTNSYEWEKGKPKDYSAIFGIID